MERGVIELFEKTTFTTASTAEDFMSYLKGAAQKFCDTFGMIIYDDWEEIKDNKYISIFVGYEDDSHPILRFCNWEYSNNYYNNFGISLTMDIGAQVATSSNTNPAAKYQMCNTASYPTYLSYIKDGDSIVFALTSTTSVPGYVTNWSWIITKAICGNGEDQISVPFAMHIYQQYVYASSDQRIGFASDQYAFTTINQMLSSGSPIVPHTKEAIMDQDICIYNTDDARITNLRLYSNKIGMPNGSVIQIAGVSYFLIFRYSANYPTILLKLSK